MIGRKKTANWRVSAVCITGRQSGRPVYPYPPVTRKIITPPLARTAQKSPIDRFVDLLHAHRAAAFSLDRDSESRPNSLRGIDCSA